MGTRDGERGARVMRGWLKFALIALLATPQCRADEHEMPDFKTMKIKELKAILADRGRECRGCAEKADYVAMAADVWSLPIVEKPASGDETKEKPATPDLDDADQERIRRMMDEMQNGPRPTAIRRGTPSFANSTPAASSSPEERECPWTSSGTWRRPWGTSRQTNGTAGTTNCESSRVVRWVSDARARSIEIH